MEVKKRRIDYRSKWVPPAQGLQLPQEILIKIFMYLSPVDKANVRATCHNLKNLIDQPLLWKNSTFVFRNMTAFNSTFLKTLQKRKVRSIEVTQVKLYQWKRLLTSLPDVLDLTLHSCLTGEAIKGMRPLTNLQRLRLTNCAGLEDQELLNEVCHFQQLTHLWLCSVTLKSVTALVGLAQLSNLYSLSLHCKAGFIPKKSLRYVLFHLPKLKDLSLSVRSMSDRCMSFCFSKPETPEDQSGEPACIPRLQLQKLEFINPGFTVLSTDALNQLSTLNTICLQHCEHRENTDVLQLMLQKLPNVTELNIAWSTSFQPYVHYIPTKLEKLCVLGMCLTNGSLDVLFHAARRLKHLDISLCYGFEEKALRPIPQAFPDLTKLYLSNIPLTEDTLVRFVQLRALRELDVSNNHLLTPEAILCFRRMTMNRVHVILEKTPSNVDCQIFSSL